MVEPEALEPEALETVEIAQSLNCKGMKCPLPIYKTSMALKSLAVNDVLEIVCTDPAAPNDFKALAAQTGNDLLKSEDIDGVQTFWLRNTG